MYIYRLGKEQLEEMAEQIKDAIITSMHDAEIVRQQDASDWADSHRVMFERTSETESKDYFSIKIVKIVAG